MIEKPKFSYVALPRYSKPQNALGGLYVEVRSTEGRAAPADILEFVRRDVEAAGYDPDGDGKCSLPIVDGIVATRYALWFYSRRSPVARTAHESHARPERRYIRLPNQRVVLVGADDFITVQVEIPLNEIIDNDPERLRRIFSEKATGSSCLTHISYAVSNHRGNVLEINVTGNCADLEVEPVDHDELPFIEFDVDVTRISYGERSVRLTARTREDALDIASDDAGNHIYPERASEYVFNAKPV